MTVVINGTSGITDVNGSAAAPAITGTDTDTGVFFGTNTVSLSTGGTERLQIDSSGNMGLGVTPSAWSGFTALQIQNGALFTDSTSFRSIMNGYYNGSNWIYSTTNAATRYEQVNGIHRWFNAASGTAGNAISFTQAMTLDASGNLQLGTTSGSGRLALDSGSSSLMATFNSTNANGGYLTLVSSGTVYGDIGTAFQAVGGSASDFAINARGARNLVFGANNTERARIDSSGNLLVGTTSVFGAGGISIQPSAGAPTVDVKGSATTNGSSVFNVYSTGASAYRFYVGMGGTISATSTTITGISDRRLKENIRDLDDGLDVVMALKPRKFDWKEGKGADIKNARGFIAQEFEQVLPDMISEWQDPAPEGEEPYKAINANLIPTLVKAIQEQQAIITQLQADVAALKGQA